MDGLKVMDYNERSKLVGADLLYTLETVRVNDKTYFVQAGTTARQQRILDEQSKKIRVVT